MLREIDLGASAGYDVTVVGWGGLDRPRPGVTMVPVRRHVFGPAGRGVQGLLVAGGRAWPRLWLDWYWRKPDHRAALAAVEAAAPDLIHANEPMALPLAIRAKERTGAAVLFDAHELGLDPWKGRRVPRLVFGPLHRHLLQEHAVRADAMITVAPRIAARYEHALGVPCGVVRNAPPYQAMDFRPLGRDRIRLLHHGVALRGRRLEDAIHTVARLDDRFELELMLVPGSPGYVESLRRLAAERAPGRVRFRPPVAPDEIVGTIADADIGLAVIPPVDESYRLSLPNKFFEYLMAGLAVVVGPSPEMAAICLEENCGIVAADHEPAAVATALASLDEGRIEAMKRAALAAARRYNAEREMETLAALYRRLMPGDDPAR